MAPDKNTVSPNSAIPELNHDALISHVFTNLRNTFLCATLGITGRYIHQNSNTLDMAPRITEILGFTLIFISILLLFWNLVHGFTRPILHWKRKKYLAVKLLFSLPFIFIYAITTIALFEVSAVKKSDSQITVHTPKT